MELIFEGKPLKSFCFSMVFNIGWRHEPPELRGSLLRTFDDLVGILKKELPEYFDVSKHIDAEFSKLKIWGTSDKAEILLEAVHKVLALPPQIFLEIGGGLIFSVAAGAMKSEVLNELERMKFPKPSKAPKVHIKPRNFFKTFNLSRLETIFLYSFLKETAGEVFLELSPIGDRIHYGKNFRLPPFHEISKYKDRFKASLAKQLETTEGTVDLLINLNIFKKEKVSIRDALEELENLDLLKKIDAIEKMFRRVSS